MTRIRMLVRSGWGHWWIVSSMLVGYGPGFALPFLMAATLRPDTSDSVLLVLSIAITAGSTLGLAIENAWAAAVSEHLSGGKTLLKADVIHGVKRALRFSGQIGLVLFLGFGFGTALVNVGSSSSMGLQFLAMAAPFPAISGAASVLNGVLNAQRRVALGIALQGVRGIFPLFGLGIALLAGLPSAILVGLVTGELCRLLISLAIVLRSVSGSEAQAASFEAPTSRALLHHTLGLSVLGTAPVIDRLFLASAGSGYVTLLEMCDRLFFAGSQIGNNLFVLPRVRQNAEDLQRNTIRQVALFEILRTVSLASVLSISIVAMLVLASLLAPTLFTFDLVLWSAILLVSLPMALGGTTATRLLVATRQTRWIPYLSTLGMASNILGNTVGLVLFGPVGILWSTVLSRFLMSAASLAILTNSPEEVDGGEV